MYFDWIMAEECGEECFFKDLSSYCSHQLQFVLTKIVHETMCILKALLSFKRWNEELD